MILREKLLSIAILDSLGWEQVNESERAASMGVVVDAIKEIDLNKTVTELLKTLDKLFVCSIGYAQPKKQKGLETANNIEAAIRWRNNPECAQFIVVFLKHDTPKRHSLENFGQVTDRTISFHLLGKAKKDLSANRQEKEFWSALLETRTKYPLSLIEDFASSVYNFNGPNNQRIPHNLWRLGLIPDQEVISDNHKAIDRLNRNKAAIEEIGQLSKLSRKRMMEVISRLTGGKKKRYSKTFKTVMAYFKYPDRETLKNLDLQTLEDLIRSGRPLPASPTIGNTTSPGNEPLNPEKPLKGKALQNEVFALIASQEKEHLTELAEFSKTLRSIFDNPEKAGEDLQLNNAVVVNPITEKKLETAQAIALCCNSNSWGGWFRSNRLSIQEAFNYFNGEAFTPYHPKTDSGFGKSLISLLSSFDRTLMLNDAFKDALLRVSEAREKLVPQVPILISHPFLTIAADKKIQRQVKDYLNAYEELIALYHTNEAALHTKTSLANRGAIAELLRLDVIHIHTAGEWKAMLTPLHPFYLWRYHEVLKTTEPAAKKLSDEEKEVLAAEMHNVPQVLHFLMSSPPGEHHDLKPLPLAGSLEELPTYENDTNRYLGADGTEFIPTVITHWLDHAPYSRKQIRIAIIDPPIPSQVFEQLIDCLEENVVTCLIVDIFMTRKGLESAQLSITKTIENNHRFHELQQERRLTLRIHEDFKFEQLPDKFKRSPVHLCVAFDQSTYACFNAPRAIGLVISPLVITHDYKYDQTFERGTIEPSSDTDQGGLFADYHFLLQKVSDLGSNMLPRLQTGQPPNFKILKDVLSKEYSQWLICADRDLSAYALGEDDQEVIQLLQKRMGHREVGLWSRSSERTLQAVRKTLERFPINDPDEKRLKAIFNKFWHVAASDWPTLLKSGAQLETVSVQKTLKGAVGTILAAAWYSSNYPDALVATLDSDLARQWLVGRKSSEKRADLIGFRVKGNDVIVEPIEVKSHKVDGDVSLERDSSGNQKLSGHAIDQLDEIVKTLKPIFGSGHDSQPLFTNARREALKLQLHRECFRDVHKHQQAQEWYEVLKSAFALPTPSVKVCLQGLVIAVKFEDLLEQAPKIVNDFSRPELAYVEIGAKALQSLLTEGSTTAGISGCDGDVGGDSGGDAHTTTKLPPRKPKPSTKKSSEKSAGKPNKRSGNVSAEFSPKRTGAQADDVAELIRSFRRACKSFSISADCESEEIVIGPHVIRIYVRLGRGQKIGKFRESLEDIGREMRRSNLVVTTVHNSDQVVLDIPRTDKEEVTLESVLGEIPEVGSLEELPFPVGVTPEGEHIIKDLSKMPHMLVAGTTGAGKTIFLYGLIASLLKTHPDSQTLRILLSSSKPEDFSMFKGVKHFEGQGVVADAKETIDLLQSCVQKEIDERSEILVEKECRDIIQYNRNHKPPISPFVIIIDEFADLSDQFTNTKARTAFYASIRRIAQAGRSRGVHLVLCTQRPSGKLLPTDIRSLMNLSVAFRMKKREDSQMIIEEPGAENLQMHGDLLMKDALTVKRAQGYLTTLHDLKVIIKDCF
jgi:hypothetical protein